MWGSSYQARWVCSIIGLVGALFVVAVFSQQNKKFCTEGLCCDKVKQEFKPYGEPCDKDPSQSCKRAASFCFGVSNECVLENIPDNTLCPNGKCRGGLCISERCDEGCCDEHHVAKEGTCKGGVCKYGVCVPENVEVLQTNFLDAKEPKVARPVPSAHEFEPEMYNSQLDVKVDMTPEEKKIFNRVDFVVSKYESNNNADLKRMLEGIRSKVTRKQEEEKKAQEKATKKMKAYQAEVEESKKRYEELEKLDA